jgi:hypothetical protein
MVRNAVPDEPTIRRQAAEPGSGGALAVHRLDWTNPAKMDDGDLLAFVANQYEAGKTRRYEWEKKASEQLAWVRGYQNYVWSDERMALEPQELADLPLQCRDPIIINKLRGFLLDSIGLILGRPMSWEVYPQTRENDDVTSAKAQAKLLRHFWGACSPSGQIKLLEAFWMMFTTGIVWGKCTWDPFAGPTSFFDADMMREEGEKDDEKTRVKWTDRLKGLVAKKRKTNPERVKLAEDGLDLADGDLALDFVSGFDVTEPEHCHLVEEASWCIVSRFRTIEYMRERFKEDAEGLEADSSQTLQQHRGYNYAAGNAVGRIGEHTDGVTESTEVLVHELWRPRSPSAPKGVCIIIAGQKVIKKAANPYVHGQIPLTTFREHAEPEAFRPVSTIADLMGLQRARNKQRSLIHAHLTMSIDPRILNEKGSGLPDDFASTGPKLVPLADGGILKVKAFEYPNPPSYLGALDEMNVRDMEDVGRVHRSTAGSKEPGTQSGKHAQLMIEGDQRGRTATKLLIQAGAERLGGQMLALIWQYYTEERSIQITGERSAPEVLTFKGRTLISRPPVGPDAANVRAMIGDQASMEDVIAKVEGLTKMGYLSAEREDDRRMVMRWVNEQVPAQTDEESEHRTNAAMENEMLMGDAKDRGSLRVAYGDNDAVHIREHEMLTTTAGYKEAKAKDPQVAVAFLVHLHEHLFSRLIKTMYPEAMKERVAEYLRGIGPPRGPEGMPPMPPMPQPGMMMGPGAMGPPPGVPIEPIQNRGMGNGPMRPMPLAPAMPPGVS